MSLIYSKGIIIYNESARSLYTVLKNKTQASSKTSKFDRIIYANRFFALLEKANDEYRTVDEPLNSQNSYIKEAIRFIKESSNLKVSVSDIVSHLNLNRTYVTALFKKHSGYSPSEYLQRHKINKACEFFFNHYATVASVADSLGYDPHAFTRLFKKIVGITPTEYRNNLTGTKNTKNGE